MSRVAFDSGDSIKIRHLSEFWLDYCKSYLLSGAAAEACKAHLEGSVRGGNFPHRQHLAAASSAGTSLVANLKHITVTLATWDAVWEVYLDPKWAQQRLRLYRAQDQALEQFFKELEEDMAGDTDQLWGRVVLVDEFQLATRELMGGEFTLSQDMGLGTKAMEVKWLESYKSPSLMTHHIPDYWASVMSNGSTHGSA
ncbi:hypothetical protein QJQ45_029342 [Haematococcus lacustris]|nr:hypothetical protein QJQ45_029342 [Haematococcus lacustris]